MSPLPGGSLTKLAYYSTVQHKVARVRSFDYSGKVSRLAGWVVRHRGAPRAHRSPLRLASWMFLM